MIDLLTSEGTDPAKITIGHAQGVGGNLTPLLEVLRRGAYVCFEHLGVNLERDYILFGTIGGLIAAGYVKQIMLSAEAISNGWMTVQPPFNLANWNQDHSFMHREVISRMPSAGISEKDIEQMIVTNPKGFLGF